MRSSLRAALFAALVVVSAPFIAAPAAVGGPGPGYFASDNVEWVANIPIHAQTAGAAMNGKYLYVTDQLELVIYDLSDPLLPIPVGELPLPQDPYYVEESLNTNGEILLISSLGSLKVVDVTDKSAPKIIGELAGYNPHTISCVLDCTWAYGSDGEIVDLREPEVPSIAGHWPGNGHDVTEVRPGIVVTSSNPILMLDAREDPAHPRVIAAAAPPDERFIHSNDWPRAGKDLFLLVGGESGPPQCDDNSAAFMTWDATSWKRTHSFKMIDELRVDSGLPTDGRMPYAIFCAHWFDTHPSFKNGGLVAMAWYENGTHFFKVSDKGKLSEVGYFLPLGGEASAPYWVTDEILYVLDYQRGLDILRWTGKV